jgi:hypothetical protein
MDSPVSQGPRTKRADSGNRPTLPRVVKKPALAVFRTVVRLNLALRRREYRYVFVLAHGRSGSTLLSHVLASHPNFTGAGELFLTYTTPSDLPNLILTTCEYLHKWRVCTPFIVDQINQDQFLTDETLKSSLVHKCVILIRSPEATLKSMMKVFGRQETAACRYYVERLATLAHYGSILRERAILVEYDDLIEHTEETLAGLTRLFAVDPPFSPEYVVHRATGKTGDPSANLLTGRIFRTPEHAIAISPEVMAEATPAFVQCRQQLLSAGVLSVREKRSARGPSEGS